MSRVVPSPVAAWPGTVTLAEPLTFPQLIAYQGAAREAKGVQDNNGTFAEWFYAILPGILACVEKWELGGGFPDGVTADTFPATPEDDSQALIGTLLRELRAARAGPQAVPNA
jgi:hypothetical protein